MIGEALISTIGDALREKFKEDVKKAWLKLFGIIECQMRLGMSQGEAEA
jgi:hemoglobin-like flavoprotein